MAPQVFAPGMAQVNLNYIYGSIAIQNTLYFQGPVGFTQADIDLLAEGVNLIAVGHFLPLLPTAITLNQIEAISLESDSGLSAEGQAGLPDAGNVSLTPLPSSCTLSVSFRTGRRGRSRRGRNYWPLLGEEEVTANNVSSTKATNIVIAYSQMIGGANVADGWTWGVYSRYSNGGQRPVGLFTEITQVLVVDTMVDSQRGRMK